MFPAIMCLKNVSQAMLFSEINQLQRSNASNKTSDHLATNIQRINPLKQTTQFRKTSNA